MIKHFSVCLAVISSITPAQAAGLRIFPPQINLTGPQTSQRIIVLQESDGKLVGDVSREVKLTSSNPTIAILDGNLVKPVGDGEAILTATLDNLQATAKVKVSRFKEPFAWSFRNDVMPMLTKAGCNSGACHGALAGKGGMKLSLRGYAPLTDYFVMTRQALGRRIDRREPHRSLLLQKPALAVSHGGGLKLEVDSSDYRVLAEWIASGAQGPRDEDVNIERLEVFPPEAILKPKNTLQVLVRAWYSDGHAQDVTHWAKFSSTEDLVASVDQEGRVKVSGHGETAISVWYSNQVATLRVLSPLPNKVDAKVFADAARNNYIDELVLKKLATLRIPPSPLCSDQEFIRRFYLDAAGILPTPEEVQKFVADRSPDKRAKLIDQLLNRPEFVDYWAYKWSDLLLVSTRRLPQPAMWALYAFIRQSVADNKPWDQFARDVMTSSGSTLQNGAANFFVLHKDVTDLTESTAITFLGTSITCARCHNHPLEKWTQDQYWGMANLFARVALKNGERNGDVIIQSQPTGDVPHPRLGVAMKPTPLDAKPLAADSAMDRRQYFAQWLTSPDNPFFARALVNRVWRNFLGRGLVEAEDDLRQTNPPTNEELFQALTKDFTDHKFDVKYLIKQIANSAAYQRSSKPVEGNAVDDRFYSHYLVRRLPAEVILDAYSQVAAAPTPFNQVYSGVEGGTAPTTSFPLGTRALQLPDTQVASRFLDGFGRPDRIQTCSCERQQESSVSQALHLNNGQTLNDKLRTKNSRLDQWLQENIGDEEAIRRLFLLALGREPAVTETAKVKILLAEAAADKQTTRREVLEDLFWAVLTNREFLFNH